jgi:hypothetical protein
LLKSVLSNHFPTAVLLNHFPTAELSSAFPATIAGDKISLAA